MKIIEAESLEERPIDRDYNAHGGKRITQPEIYGGVLHIALGWCTQAK
jgi:hypothetical protein